MDDVVELFSGPLHEVDEYINVIVWRLGILCNCSFIECTHPYATGVESVLCLVNDFASCETCEETMQMCKVKEHVVIGPLLPVWGRLQPQAEACHGESLAEVLAAHAVAQGQCAKRG